MLPPSERAWHPLNYLKISQNPALSLLGVFALALNWRAWEEPKQTRHRSVLECTLLETPFNFRRTFRLCCQGFNHYQFNRCFFSRSEKKKRLFKIYILISLFMFSPVIPVTANDEEDRAEKKVILNNVGVKQDFTSIMQQASLVPRG